MLCEYLKINCRIWYSECHWNLINFAYYSLEGRRDCILISYANIWNGIIGEGIKFFNLGYDCSTFFPFQLKKANSKFDLKSLENKMECIIKILECFG